MMAVTSFASFFKTFQMGCWQPIGFSTLTPRRLTPPRSKFLSTTHGYFGKVFLFGDRKIMDFIESFYAADFKLCKKHKATM